MIEVIYYRKNRRVTIKGHAHADEPGKDLVCCSATTLALTLGSNVAMLEEKGWVRSATVRMDSGDAEICCTPSSHFKAIVDVIFSTVCIGFEQLALANPQYMRYEIHS